MPSINQETSIGGPGRAPVQLVFDPPYINDWFNICNGTAQKTVGEWWMHLNGDAGRQNFDSWISTIRRQPDAPRKRLEDILALVGLPARLTIGTYGGSIIRPDVPPTGWTYPWGAALPDSWHWLWLPDRPTAELILREQRAGGDFEKVFFGGKREDGFLKALVPYQMHREHGDFIKLHGLPVLELPRWAKPALWVFDF